MSDKPMRYKEDVRYLFNDALPGRFSCAAGVGSWCPGVSSRLSTLEGPIRHRGPHLLRLLASAETVSGRERLGAIAGKLT